MREVELVVKIPEDAYDFIKRTGYHTQSLYNAIKNGTPLPKGHGRILDEKDILDTKNNDGCLYDLYDMPDYIAGVKAIIEADTEGEE